MNHAANGSDKPRSFGELIRQRRRELDLTQEDVADRIGTSIPFVGHLEAGKRRPSEITITKLADALGLERGELFFLANPEAKALFENAGSKTRSAWETFKKDLRLHRAQRITPAEMEMLAQVPLMGEVRSIRDFIYILQTVRHSLSR
jgi:transcriptional regulator with XRE-family HTH domain